MSKTTNSVIFQSQGVRKMGIFWTVVIVWTIIGILTNWGYGYGRDDDRYDDGYRNGYDDGYRNGYDEDDHDDDDRHDR